MRKLLIAVLFKRTAGSSDANLARLLNRFSIVEADSAWQMLQAMDEVDDPAYRAELFNNALEEVHHAWLFKRQAYAYAEQVFTDDFHNRKKILGKNGDLLSFKIEHFLGEKDVYEQFLTYAEAVPQTDVKELFMKIRGDEEEHQRKARLKLLEELGSEKALHRKILRFRLKDLYENWIKLGKWMGNITFTILLSSLYLIGGIFFKAYCKRHLHDPQLADRISNLLLAHSINFPKPQFQ